MALWFQLTINGLVNGAVIALFALGFILIYRASRVLNFAEAATGTFAAYLVYELVGREAGDRLPWTVAVLIALVAAGVFGFMIERGAIRPLRNAPIISPTIATVMLTGLISALVVLIWAGQSLPIRDQLPEGVWNVGEQIGLAGAVISWAAVVTFLVTTVVAVVLTVLFRITRWGVAARAVSEDRETAQLMGISIETASLGSWVLGSVVAALGAILFTSTFVLQPIVVGFLQVKALAVALFAGLISLPMALVGGFALGLLEQYVTRFNVQGLQESVAFFALVILLVVRSDWLGRVTGGGGVSERA